MSGSQIHQQNDSTEPYTIFTPSQKGLILLTVSGTATLSGFASNIYFPAIPTISKDLSVSIELVNLTVTCYMIFQGLSPTIWAALSDVKGRRVTYICTLSIFLGACVGLALTKDYAQLLVLRCLQSTGSASTIAIGAGVIGDITKRENRGGYMGIFQGGLLLPVAIGPVIGGLLSEKLGWKSVFWFLTIYGAAFFALVILILPETLRSLVGNGSRPVTGLARSPLAAWQQRRHSNIISAKKRDEAPTTRKTINFLEPLQILVRMRATFAILFVSVHYMTWQMMLTALSLLFETTYGLSQGKVGLIFMANGIGSMIGTLLTGKLLDLDYRRVQRRREQGETHLTLEWARLRTVWLWSWLQCASVLVFGWTTDKAVHISVPIICIFILGWTAISIQSVVSTYLVDVHHKQSASAMASLNLLRCLLGAGGTAAVGPLMTRINAGWTFTLLTALMIGSGGFMLVQMWYGPKWRKKDEEIHHNPEAAA